MSKPIKILDKLENIFGADFKDVLSGNKTKISLINFSKPTETENNFEVKDNIIMINPTFVINLPEKKKKAFKEEIIDVEIKEDKAILEKNVSERTTKIKEKIQTKKDEELLEYYEGKLSQEYIDALESALVIKNMAKKREDISKEKASLSRRYQSFGGNLCNLTSEGYFNGHFQELYEDMNHEISFSNEAFRRQVEKIVVGLPYTVFVNSFASAEDKITEVKLKIERLRRYGTVELLIHGLGRDNVEKAIKIIKAIEKEYPEIKVILDKTNTRITATLRL